MSSLIHIPLGHLTSSVLRMWCLTFEVGELSPPPPAARPESTCIGQSSERGLECLVHAVKRHASGRVCLLYRQAVTYVSHCAPLGGQETPELNKHTL